MIVSSQRTFQDISFGGGILFGLTGYNSSFENLENIDNCCPIFQSGTGVGLSAEAFVDIRLSGIAYLSLRFTYHDLSGKFEENEIDSIDFNNAIYPARISHELNTDLHMIGFEPHLLLLYNRLSLFGGLGLGFFISDHFNQSELLVEPTNFGTFENGRRIRNEVEGNIPALNDLTMYFSIGAGYEINMNKDGTLRFRPEIQFKSSMLSIISSDRWNFSKLIFGIKIKFGSLSGFDSPLVPNEK